MLLRRPRNLAILALVLVSLAGAHGVLADQFYNSGGRADFIDTGEAIPVRRAPDLLLLSRVPDEFDPAVGPFRLGCFLQARDVDGFSLIPGVKARYTAELAVLDLDTGTFTTRRVGKGKTKTGNPGTTFFTDIEPEDFGDRLPDRYVAFVQTGFQMKNRKAISGLTAICDASTRLDP